VAGGPQVRPAGADWKGRSEALLQS